MCAIHLDERIAFLAQQAGNRPVSFHRDTHKRDPHPKILNVCDDVRQVFLCAHDDGVGDGVVMGECGQIAVKLCVHAVTAAGPYPSEPQLETRKVGQRFMIWGPPTVDGRVIPVAPEQRQPATLAGEVAQ